MKRFVASALILSFLSIGLVGCGEKKAEKKAATPAATPAAPAGDKK
jgi:hypothetical protein